MRIIDLEQIHPASYNNTMCILYARLTHIRIPVQ